MKITIKVVLVVLGVSFISLSCKNNQQNSNKSAINSTAKSSTESNKDTQETQGKITILSVAEFKEKSKNQQILDVRTPSEFSQGYIKGAKNINIFDKNFIAKLDSLNKNKPIYVYCKSGHRSGIAVKQMAKLGFMDIYDLKGGIINWTKSNNEIEK